MVDGRPTGNCTLAALADDTAAATGWDCSYRPAGGLVPAEVPGTAAGPDLAAAVVPAALAAGAAVAGAGPGCSSLRSGKRPALLCAAAEEAPELRVGSGSGIDPSAKTCVLGSVTVVRSLMASDVAALII